MYQQLTALFSEGPPSDEVECGLQFALGFESVISLSFSDAEVGRATGFGFVNMYFFRF